MADAKILVVDDDKKIVELVTLYLKKDGYQVLAPTMAGRRLNWRAASSLT